MWLFAVASSVPRDDEITMSPDRRRRTAPDRRPAASPAGEFVPTRRRVPLSTDELHICVICTGELVHPFEWVAEGPRHWRVLLRCPDCHAIREGLFTQAAVDDLADELDRGAGILIRALQELTSENMAGEIDVFIHALNDDLILPCDF